MPLSAEDRAHAERILAEARQRFLSEGFSSVTMDDLASDLGMSKKTLYKFFPSKEVLIEKIVARTMVEARASIGAIIRGDQDFVEKFRTLLTFFATQASRIHRPFIRDLQRHAPGLWGRIEKFRQDRINEILVRLLSQGRKEGYVHPGLNPRVFLLAYVGAVNSLVNPSVLAEESFSPPEAIEGVLLIFFQGILTEEGRERLRSLSPDPLLQHR